MHLSYLGTNLCLPSLYHVAAWLFNQHPFIIREAVTSKVLLHFRKQKKVRWCQVRTLRMLKDVPMELLMQHGLCLLGSMRTYIVMQQNNSTRGLASSAR